MESGASASQATLGIDASELSRSLSIFGMDGGNKEQNSVCVVLWLKKK
jgi:hypothetical protein